ncbi:hypothetical protein P4534_14030 [Peribacillus butanolivorans]|uniref:hypothetical protein n=1 Tax=Peribacillus butanolivorans TaxID=421767 RepID=UPI002E203435|nr:hypothetical protein [Peribacillus butanolivorans]
MKHIEYMLGNSVSKQDYEKYTKEIIPNKKKDLSTKNPEKNLYEKSEVNKQKIIALSVKPVAFLTYPVVTS